MIARLSTNYIKSRDEAWTADLVAALARYGHLADCDDECMDLIERCVDSHCSTTEKEIIGSTSLYEVTALQRRFLTTIDVDGSMSGDMYLNLFGNPSLVLLENGPNEWNVYLQMMEAYKHDRKYGNIFKLLRKAAKNKPSSLESLHAGGKGHVKALINDHNENKAAYRNLAKYKIYTVNDCDRTSTDCDYDPTTKSNYRFLCGFEEDAIVDRCNIDTLTQPLYHWHLWRKRAIENYMTPEAYEAVGMNADRYADCDLPERDYLKVDGSLIPGYNKNRIAEVAKSMSHADYESVCDRIGVNGEVLSEIQLFLLKMAKVV